MVKKYRRQITRSTNFGNNVHTIVQNRRANMYLIGVIDNKNNGLFCIIPNSP